MSNYNVSGFTNIDFVAFTQLLQKNNFTEIRSTPNTIQSTDGLNPCPSLV